jgi:hypothetical protein
VETITPEMLQWVWQQFDYGIDVCRVMKGAHIKYGQLSFRLTHVMIVDGKKYKIYTYLKPHHSFRDILYISTKMLLKMKYRISDALIFQRSSYTKYDLQNAMSE